MHRAAAAALAAALALCLACGKDKDKGEDEPPVKPTPPIKERSVGVLGAGTEAPEFTATAHDGTPITMSALRGQTVVLYFYPKDETPGWTAEAEAFCDVIADYRKLNVKIIGVSMDDNASHKAFAAKHDILFPLLPDTDGAIAAKYGVSTSRGFAERVTFIIDKNGVIAKVFPRVKVVGHAAEVLEAVKALPPG